MAQPSIVIYIGVIIVSRILVLHYFLSFVCSAMCIITILTSGVIAHLNCSRLTIEFNRTSFLHFLLLISTKTVVAQSTLIQLKVKLNTFDHTPSVPFI
jgi:hypothetical protein